MSIIKFIILFSIFILINSCHFNRDPVSPDAPNEPKIVLDSLDVQIFIKNNTNNNNIETNVLHTIEYHFENCFGIIDHYSVEVDTFRGYRYDLDYFTPFPPNDVYIVSPSFWLSTELTNFDSISVEISICALFWEEESFYSKFIGGNSPKINIVVPVYR